MHALVFFVVLIISSIGSADVIGVCTTQKEMAGIRAYILNQFNRDKLASMTPEEVKTAQENLQAMLNNAFPNDVPETAEISRAISKLGYEEVFVAKNVPLLQASSSKGFSGDFAGMIHGKKIDAEAVRRFLEQRGLQIIPNRNPLMFDRLFGYEFASRENGLEVHYRVWAHSKDKVLKEAGLTEASSARGPTARIQRKIPIQQISSRQSPYRTEFLNTHGEWVPEITKPRRDNFKSDDEFNSAMKKYIEFSDETHIPAAHFNRAVASPDN